MYERLHSPGMTPGWGSVWQAKAYEVFKKRASASAGHDIDLAKDSFRFSPCRIIKGAEAEWMQYRMEMSKLFM
jgi:hypothetical protein